MNRLTKFIKCAALFAAGVLSVQDATGEISVVASREYVDRKVGPKRDKDDYKIYRKVKDCWTWTNWASPDATASAPADFLAAVNSPTAEPVYFANGTWWGANQFWPNGNRKYMKELGPYGTGTELSLNWAFTAYAEDGTNELFRFGATSVRTNATDETLICWDSVNPSVRIATTDQIDGAIKKTDGAMRPLPKYLWLYETDDPYLYDAKAWYTNYDHVVSGGCSALRKGGLLGRNFDFPYDERAEFVVKVPASGNRRASVGVSNLGTNITEQFVVSGRPSPLYKVLPGVIVDGINDAGVVAEINVIPRDPTRDPEQGIDPHTGIDRQLSAFAVVRHVLDNFISAAEAAEYVAANYYIPAGSPNAYHWMIADKDGTYIVEDGQVVQATPTADGCALVNFRVVSEGAYDPAGGYATDPYGSGSARFAALTNASSVQSGLSAVLYTHAYAVGWPWLDEFAGASDAIGVITHDDVARLMVYANDKVAPKLNPTTRMPKARGNGCWQTVHSAIYDITNLTLRIAVQETDDWYTFAVPSAGGVNPEEVREIVSQMIDEATNAVNAAKRDKTDLTVYETQYTDWYVDDGVGYEIFYAEGQWVIKYDSVAVDEVHGPEDVTELTFNSNVGSLHVVYAWREKTSVQPTSDTIATSNGVAAAIVANVENSTGSDSTTKSLSAKMGKALQEQIQNLKQRGRYLSIWDCTTGLAKTEPTVNPYEYKTGDYFIVGTVGTVGTTNYRPSGNEYDKTAPSTTVETDSPIVNDTYYYDGTSWSLLHTEQPTVSWGSVADKPSEFPPSAHTHTKSQITDFPTPVAPSTSAAQGAFADANLTAQQLANKQDAISDLASIRSGASAGSAALQRQYEGRYIALIEWDLDSDRAPFLQLVGAPLIIGDYRAATMADLAAYLPDATPAYSASATYSVGAFVRYNGAVYVCKTAITAAESWTPEHWTEMPSVSALFGSGNTALTASVNALIEARIGDIEQALKHILGGN